MTRDMSAADAIAYSETHNEIVTVAWSEPDEIVRMLYAAGWRDDKIREELGMDEDEVRRLKQMTGLASLFAEREFSKAWEPAR